MYLHRDRDGRGKGNMVRHYCVAGRVLEIRADFENEETEETERFRTRGGKPRFRICFEKAEALERPETPDISMDPDSMVSVHMEKGEPVQIFHVTDVSENDWYYDAVRFVYENGIMTGTGSSHTTFSPNDSLCRAQLAVILYRIAGEPEVTSENRFPDVPETEWYRDAVVWADAAGVATGYANGNFGPCDEITREQLAVMLYRYAQKNGMDVTAAADLSRYEDADQVSAFARTAMEWAVAEGIISGKYDQTQLDPQGSATRAECAAVIMRYMEKLEQQA